MHISIIGLGLIGASLGGALHQRGYNVVGYDSNPTAAHVAEMRGLVDTVCPTVEEAVRGSEVVILATPVATIISLLPQLAAIIDSDSILTDVGSAKKAVIAAMDALPDTCRAVGGHPIAGREQSGPTAADPGLFAGKPYAIVPSTHSDAAAIATIEVLARAIGAQPILVSADVHDAVLARTSHIPQLLASALALSLEGERYTSLSGTGLQDMTRLAASDPQLWSEVLCLNATNVVAAGRRYLEVLTYLLHKIEEGDQHALHDALCASAKFRVQDATMDLQAEMHPDAESGHDLVDSEGHHYNTGAKQEGRNVKSEAGAE
jgi:prephenate dehydrogenase